MPKTDEMIATFCPKLRKFEDGITYRQVDGIKTKITNKGYTPPTKADEKKILEIMKNDPACGIARWEDREMPKEQRSAEAELRQERAEKEAALSELEKLRAEVKRYQTKV